jgi:hypothetical protein
VIQYQAAGLTFVADMKLDISCERVKRIYSSIYFIYAEIDVLQMQLRHAESTRIFDSTESGILSRKSDRTVHTI